MLNTLFRKLSIGLVFGLAFVINPAYVTGCDSSEEEPSFGEAEMLGVLEHLNAMGVSVIEDGEARYEVELTLEQAEGEDSDSASKSSPSAFASTAYACGSRSFMKSAAACVTVTTMPLEGTLTIRRVDGDAPVVVVRDLPVTGDMIAYGDSLRSAQVELQLEGGGHATLDSDNARDFSLVYFDAQDLGDEGVDINFALITTADA